MMRTVRQVKAKIKSMRDGGITFDYKKLVRLASGKQVISFDIFDTLIKRSVQNPDDVFRLVEKKYNTEHGNVHLSFSDRRITAERNARALSHNEEITIEEIYANLQGFNDDQKRDLKELELSLEYDLACQNVYLRPFVDWCIERGKKIICVSDIYFSKEFVRAILNKCGYEYINSVFLSSEYRKTKRTGTLFRTVIDSMKIQPATMLHIGDSKRGDFIMPQRFGILAYQIPIKFIRRKNIPNKLIAPFDRFEFSCLQAFIDNHIDVDKDEFYQFGYDRFGMMLWGFVSWLYQSLKENHISKVYFFSRDGYIIKKAFDLEYAWDRSIQTYYLEVSRRSLRVPILWMNSELSTLLNMISPCFMIPLASIFDGVGLDPNQYSDLIRSCGLNVNTEFYRNSIIDDPKLRILYDKIKPDILQQSKCEFSTLAAYISQMDMKDKFAVVDIGWSGGMQRNLCKILDQLQIKHEIYGYYFGIADSVKKNIADYSLRLKGYLFDFSSNPDARDLRSSFVGLFETLFLEQDGSVKNYIKQGDRIAAERYSYEYSIDGEIQMEALAVANLQKGALDFIRDIQTSKTFSEIEFSPVTLFSKIGLTGAFPKKRDVKLFGDFRFFDEGLEGCLAKPGKFAYNLVHPKLLKRDFLKSRWKVGFMKRFCAVPLPYEKIYLELKKFKGN